MDSVLYYSLIPWIAKSIFQHPEQDESTPPVTRSSLYWCDLVEMAENWTKNSSNPTGIFFLSTAA